MFRCSNQQHSAALGKCSHTQWKGYLLRDSLFEKLSPDLDIWSEGYKEPEAEERAKAAGPTVLKAENLTPGNCKGLCCFLLVLMLNRKLQNRAGRNHPSVVKFRLDHQKMTKLPLYTLLLIQPVCDKIQELFTTEFTDPYGLYKYEPLCLSGFNKRNTCFWKMMFS